MDSSTTRKQNSITTDIDMTGIKQEVEKTDLKPCKTKLEFHNT
jgi:hypothetical protein